MHQTDREKCPQTLYLPHSILIDWLNHNFRNVCARAEAIERVRSLVQNCKSLHYLRHYVIDLHATDFVNNALTASNFDHNPKLLIYSLNRTATIYYIEIIRPVPLIHSIYVCITLKSFCDSIRAHNIHTHTHTMSRQNEQ